MQVCKERVLVLSFNICILTIYCVLDVKLGLSLSKSGQVSLSNPTFFRAQTCLVFDIIIPLMVIDEESTNVRIFYCPWNRGFSLRICMTKISTSISLHIKADCQEKLVYINSQIYRVRIFKSYGWRVYLKILKMFRISIGSNPPGFTIVKLELSTTIWKSEIFSLNHIWLLNKEKRLSGF